jgi:hypothetical protein
MGFEKREVLIDSFVPNVNKKSNKHTYVRRFVMTKLRFELTGTLVVGTKDATLNEGGVLNFIKRLVFTLFGDTIPFSASGPSLHRINSTINADREFISQPAVTVGSNTFALSMDMRFTMEDFILAEGFKLVTDKFRGRDIKEPTYDILLGDETDIATAGAGGTIALSGLSVNVYAQDEDVEQKENEIREEIIDVEDLTVASAADGLVDLRDNNILRRIAFLVRNNASPNVLSDDVIDEIQIVRNSDQIIKRVKWKDAQNDMKKQYGMSDDLFSKIAVGFLMLQLDKEGDLSGFIDTALKAGSKSVQLKIIPVSGQTAHVTTHKEMILGRA